MNAIKKHLLVQLHGYNFQPALKYRSLADTLILLKEHNEHNAQANKLTDVPLGITTLIEESFYDALIELNATQLEWEQARTMTLHNQLESVKSH